MVEFSEESPVSSGISLIRRVYSSTVHPNARTSGYDRNANLPRIGNRELTPPAIRHPGPGGRARLRGSVAARQAPCVAASGVLAFQTDVTRIITCMFGREGSEQKYRMVGISEGHHELTARDAGQQP